MSTAGLQAGYGQLSLAFTVNEGQTAAPINYLAQGSGYSIALTAQQAQLSLGQGNTSTALDVQLLGANPSAQAIGHDKLITKTNYLIGSDASKWLTNIANYGQVEYQNVYQGVDALYSGNQGRLETTFLVHPGANASVIQMQIQGAEGLSLDAQGNLVIHAASGDVTEQAPVMCQDINGARQAVSGSYVLEGKNTVGFQVGAYDHSQTLVIDPTLSYSSYLPAGGTGIAVDGSGNAYVVGTTASGFPTTTGAFQTTFGGGSSFGDAFVAKLNATGTALVYATYLGGSGDDAGQSIAVDSADDAYVTGFTYSSNFPTTANAFQAAASGNGFVTVLNSTGSGLIYSTYLPGVGWDIPEGAVTDAIAVDSSGNAYVTGPAGPNFVTTAGAFQPAYPGTRNNYYLGGTTVAFLAKIDPQLSGSSSLVYATFLGGSGGSTPTIGAPVGDAGTGIAVDGSGNAYLTGFTWSTNFPTTPGAFQQANSGGEDMFIAKLNPSLNGSVSLAYSTYLGGKGNDGYVSCNPYYQTYNSQGGPGIAVDGSGDVYVTGTTESSNFPTTKGAFDTRYQGSGDAFVTKLNAEGTGLVYSTYLGGKNLDGGSSIAVDSSGNAYVTGWTLSTNFPTYNPIQSQKASGTDSNGKTNSDVFVTTLNATGSGLLFSTYLGGSGDDYGFGLALDSAKNVYVTGQANAFQAGANNFPTTPGAYDTTTGGGFIFMIDPPAGGGAAGSATISFPSGVRPAPLPADQLFTLVGNSTGVSAIPSVLSSLLSEWQSLESAFMERFDALLSLEAGAMGLSKGTLIRDLLFTSEFLPASL